MNPEPPAGVETAAGLGRLARPTAELARWLGVALAAVLLAAAMVLGWRRVAGALSAPLSPAALLLVATLLAAVALGARWAWSYGREREPTSLAARSAALSLSAALVAIGATLSLPGTSVGGLLLFWGILVAEECWAWRRAGRRRLAPGRSSGPAVELNRTHAPQRFEPRAAQPSPMPDAPPAQEVTQQMVRSLAPGGGEVLAGWMRVPMALGQRSTSVHLAFCPPFSRTPRVKVEQLEGPRARIKTVQLLPYGARFDLKLAAQTDTAVIVLLRFSAETAPPAPDSDATSAGGEPPVEG